MSDRIVVLNLLLSVLAFSLIARWYVMPRLAGVARERALQPFLLLHSFRHIGLMFLAPGAVKAELPSVFAQPAAFGDLLASLLAFLALAALRLRWGGALALVWVFNVVGSLDLVYALTQGTLSHAAAGMGATFWIPAFVVPALLVTHTLVFRLLLLPSDAPRRGRR